MVEGWLGDQYLVLFDEAESAAASARYGISGYLAGYMIVGFWSWEHFILRGPDGGLWTVSTVPIVAEHLAKFETPVDPLSLEKDARFLGKLKWYVHPLVFGGNPSAEDNRVWVDHVKHAELVRWWNDLYRRLK